MRNSRYLLCALLTSLSALAQTPQISKPAVFETTLAPVALDTAMRATVAGTGEVKATLLGAKLTVEGTFSGLKSNATVAHIHQGTAPGVRGDKILDLMVTPSTSGTISGVFTLTLQQVESLSKGTWYVQIHSEKAPAGNLWGWLLYTGRKQ